MLKHNYVFNTELTRYIVCSSLPLVNQNKVYFSSSPYPKNTNFANCQFRAMRGIKFITS
jgi:hypothetical protein